MKKPLVSVLMPTWNRDYTIQNAIQSIIDQTFEDWELLIVDDGSHDMTKRIVSSYKDKRIRYEPLGKHLGLVAALEAGNNLAKGEIIVKQDSDDISMPNRIEMIIKMMTITKAELFYHSLYKVWQDEENPDVIHREYLRAKPITDAILKAQYIPGAFAYTKKFITEVPYRYLECSEDWMLILDAYFKKREINFIDEGLYDLLVRPDSNSVIKQGTDAYKEDEKAMRHILKSEYGISNFRYGFKLTTKVE